MGKVRALLLLTLVYSAMTMEQDEYGVDLEDLGTAKDVTKDKTTIVSENNDSETSDNDDEKLMERLAKLSGRVTAIKPGAATELERKERRGRVEDAMQATRGAVEEGTLPDGVVALLYNSSDFHKLSDAENKGINIIKKVLSEQMSETTTVGVRETTVVLSAEATTEKKKEATTEKETEVTTEEKTTEFTIPETDKSLLLLVEK